MHEPEDDPPMWMVVVAIPVLGLAAAALVSLIGALLGWLIF